MAQIRKKILEKLENFKTDLDSKFDMLFDDFYKGSGFACAGRAVYHSDVSLLQHKLYCPTLDFIKFIYKTHNKLQEINSFSQKL